MTPSARAGAMRRALRPVRRLLAYRPEIEPLTGADLGVLARRLRASGRAPRTPVPEPPRSATAPPPSAGPEGLVEARALLATREISAAELTEAAVSRAEATKHLNAFIRVEESAVETARAVDALPAGSARSRPLLGIPVTVKDIVDVAGLPTTSGSRFPHAPTEDASAWAALRRAGAVLIGKTNLHEFAFGVTGANPHFGTVRNPRDPTRIAGGSSSGSAASLAAGVGFGSLGTDTAGSIRIPASLTGVFGFKPTFGSVPRDGVTPLSWSLDHVGPMARSAADVEVLWEALSGPDDAPPAASESRATSKPLAGIRVALPEHPFFDGATAAARNAAVRVFAGLVALGARPVEMDVPEIEFANPCRDVIAFAEAFSWHRKRLETRRSEYGESVRELLETGSMILADDLLAAMRGRRVVVEAFARAFDPADLLVAPTTPDVAPRTSEDALPSGEPLRPGLLRLTAPFNLIGCPVLQAPAGVDPAGLPLGVQLAAPFGADRELLRVARHLEAAGVFPVPPVSEGPPVGSPDGAAC